jgi:hypothetical protein
MKRILAVALLVVSFPASAVLYCANDDYNQHGSWYVGEVQSFTLDTVGDLWCLANGPELTYIQRNFSSLRMRTGKNSQGGVVVIWEADDAAFIINNL